MPDAEPVLRRFGFDEHCYVACQLASNNPKKDWPIDSWRRVIGSLSHLRFVALGSEKDRERAVCIQAPNFVNLCGQTTLPESIALITHAQSFAGIDSGLAHVAANVGVRTVVVAQNSTLGWFFPYPKFLQRSNLIAIHNAESPACVGTFFRCPRESLWEMAVLGARCLRELSWEKVALAIAEQKVSASPI